MTVVAKSTRSTKSDVMMLTPMAPGFWVFTQSRMAGRFLYRGKLEKKRKQTVEFRKTPPEMEIKHFRQCNKNISIKARALRICPFKLHISFRDEVVASLSEKCTFRVSVLEEIIGPKGQRDPCQQDLGKLRWRAYLLTGSLIFYRKCFYHENFQTYCNTKEIYSKYLHHLDSATNILLYLLINTSIHQSITLSFHQYILYFSQIPTANIYTNPLNTSECIPLTRVPYLFSVFLLT